MSANGSLVLFMMFPISMIVLMVWVQFTVERLFMSVSQDVVDAVVVQLGKAKDEIVAEIGRLSAAAAAGEAVDLGALKELAQGLDDIVPDAVEEVAVEEVPGDEVVV